MDKQLIDSLQSRTDSKIRFADLLLKELEALPTCNGDDFERSHQEAYLFHLLGALDAFLAEINCYYQCNLLADGISAGNLRKAIVASKGENAAELRELHLLENLEGSWLSHAKTMRDYSTHRGGVPRVFNMGGATWLKNPKTGSTLEEHYPVLYRRWQTEMAEIVTRLRETASLQMR
jgi:hypothetical protein